MKVRSISIRSLIVPAMILLWMAANVSGEVRTWTSTTGQKLKATLKEISADNKTVVLVDEKGKNIPIQKELLSIDDIQYIFLDQLEKTDKSVIFFQGTNMTFSIARDGVLHIDGTGLKTVWPNGRPPERKRSRHDFKLIPLKPGENKKSIVVKDKVHWSMLKLDKLVDIVEKAIARSEDVIKNKISVESWGLYDNTELINGRVGGVSFSLTSQAGLEGVSRAKASILKKTGNLAFLKISVYNGDGSANSDLIDLSEAFNLTQQKALLRSLNSIPKDKFK